MFKQGDLVDVIDLDSVWREGIINAVLMNDYHVHFKGWSVKWDEIIPKNSQRILPAFTKLKDWRKTLKLNDPVEICLSPSIWVLAIITKINKNSLDLIYNNNTMNISLDSESLSSCNTHFFAGLDNSYLRATKYQPEKMYFYISNNSISGVKNLLSKDPSKVDKVIAIMDKTPLAVSIQQGNLEIFKYLLEQGADPHYKHKNFGYFHHIISCNHKYQIDMLEKLISLGVNVNQCDSRLYTPLHRAAMRGNTKICSLLLENNADPNLLDMNGISALRLAIYRGELQSIKLLLLYNSKIEKGMEKVACLYRNTHQYSTIIKTLQIFPILKNYIVIHQILEFL